MTVKSDVLECAREKGVVSYYDILLYSDTKHGRAHNIVDVYHAFEDLEDEGEMVRISCDTGVKYELCDAKTR